jgi:hypothetical protein
MKGKKNPTRKSGNTYTSKTPEFVSVGSIEASVGGWSRVELFARFEDQAVARDSVARLDSDASNLPFVERKLSNAEYVRDYLREQRDRLREESRKMKAIATIFITVLTATLAYLAA